MQRIPLLLAVATLVSMVACKTSTTGPLGPAPRGVITGTVVDAYSGATIAGASLTVTPDNKTVSSDSVGTFEFDSITVGTCTLTVTKSAFKDLSLSVHVTADSLSRVTAPLVRVVSGQIAAWQPQASGTSADLTAVAAASSMVFYAVGIGGTVLRSTNAGSSWTSVTLPTSASLYAVHFFSDKLGYIAGNNGLIFATSDGGYTWTQQESGNYAERGMAGAGNTGITVGSDGNGSSSAYWTRDGGVTWTDISTQLSTSDPLYCAAVSGAGKAVIAGTYNTAATSNDGGNTWRIAPIVPYCGMWRGASMLDGLNITLVGQNGAIVHSSNFGASWSVPGGTTGTNDLHAVWFSNTTYGIAVGNGGTILSTHDGGANFTSMNTSMADLNGVCSSDLMHWVIVGQGGTILTAVVY